KFGGNYKSRCSCIVYLRDEWHPNDQLPGRQQGDPSCCQTEDERTCTVVRHSKPVCLLFDGLVQDSVDPGFEDRTFDGNRADHSSRPLPHHRRPLLSKTWSAVVRSAEGS